MSTTADHSSELEHARADHADHAEHGAHEHGEHEHKPTSFYVKVALFLGVLTALETATYWVVEELGAFLVPSLLIMMAVKFVIVASLFMHLKWDSKIFSWLFYSGLFLAIGVYAAFLATFRFFGST
jgi:cytochrome c oxidase subunit 4